MSLQMDANSKHLLKWWAVTLPFCAIVVAITIAGLGTGLRHGQYTPVVAVAVAAVIVVITIVLNRGKALRLFREQTPDRAIAFYHGSMGMIPNGRAMAAYLSAYAAVIYGQFDRAREELATVNWDILPPMYQGLQTYIHSLLAMFESKDYSRALLLAEEARDLGDAGTNFPGVASSRAAFEANIAICKLLSGNDNPEILTQLENAVRKLPSPARAIPAWALATYYTNLGRRDQADKHTSLIRQLLPHSFFLKSLTSTATTASRNLA